MAGRGRVRAFAVALGLALLASAPVPAFAHGGKYQPPPEDPPPPPPDPPPPPPPQEKPPSDSKPPGTPTKPDPPPPPKPGTPTTGGGAGTPTPPPSHPPGDPTPDPRRVKRSGRQSLEDWTAWWYYSRDRYLVREGKDSSSGSGSLGASSGALSTQEDGANERAWRARALAALRHAFPDADVEVFTGCAVALGKAGDATDAPSLLRALGQAYGDPSMRESIVLGLGLLGRGAPGARAALTEVLRDRKESNRIRGMAAIALGLSGDAAAAPLLMATARERGPSKDPPAAALVGVGLLGEPLVVQDLVVILDDPNAADTRGVRPQAAYALGRLGGPEAVRGLGRALGDSDPQVRRAAILALGECAPADVAPLAPALAHGVREDRDRACRNFASVVLGRIGGVEALDALSRRFALGDRGERDFATIGLGLWARGTEDADAKARISASLRSDFQNRDDADYRSALAIALGLMRDRKAIPNMRSVLKERGDPELRAHCALALGLAGAKEAEGDLRACLVEKGNPVLQREAALALGLLGDPAAAKVLADLVSGPGVPEHVRASAARALGNLGGEAAAQVLESLLSSRDASGAARGQAAVGIGLILDRRQPGALTAVSEGIDFLAPSPAILEVLTIP